MCPVHTPWSANECHLCSYGSLDRATGEWGWGWLCTHGFSATSQVGQLSVSSSRTRIPKSVGGIQRWAPRTYHTTKNKWTHCGSLFTVHLPKLQGRSLPSLLVIQVRISHILGRAVALRCSSSSFSSCLKKSFLPCPSWP